ANALHQPVSMQHGVNGAFGGDPDITIQSPHQELANLARTPMRLVLFEGDDQALDLRWQLVGIAYRPTRTIIERLETTLLVAAEDLVAGLARNAKLAANIVH